MLWGLNEKLHVKDYVTQRQRLLNENKPDFRQIQARSCPPHGDATGSSCSAPVSNLWEAVGSYQPALAPCGHGLAHYSALLLSFLCVRVLGFLAGSMSLNTGRAVEAKLKPMRLSAPSPLPRRGDGPL